MGLVDFESSPEFTAVEKLALRYAVAMTATPVELADDLFNAMRARFDHAFGCEAEGFSEGAFCPLPKRPPTSS
jgi:hypothetical protein